MNFNLKNIHSSRKINTCTSEAQETKFSAFCTWLGLSTDTTENTCWQYTMIHPSVAHVFHHNLKCRSQHFYNVYMKSFCQYFNKNMCTIYIRKKSCASSKIPKQFAIPVKVPILKETWLASLKKKIFIHSIHSSDTTIFLIEHSLSMDRYNKFLTEHSLSTDTTLTCSLIKLEIWMD